jgi:zinc transport system ATP-binding protein
MSLIELEGLVAGYEQPATAPCSLHLARGEIVGLWGSNGAGKSTLLKALVGLARIHAGRVLRSPGLQVAFLPQAPVRLAEMPLTGHEFLAFAGADCLPPPASLAARLDRRLDALSGGEFQLLSLWASLAVGGDLVLLDEPTNNLDQAHLALAREEILSGSSTRGCLVVSHDRDFLAALGARIVNVQSGRSHG